MSKKLSDKERLVQALDALENITEAFTKENGRYKCAPSYRFTAREEALKLLESEGRAPRK